MEEPQRPEDVRWDEGVQCRVVHLPSTQVAGFPIRHGDLLTSSNRIGRGPQNKNLFRNMSFDAQTFLQVSHGNRGTSQTLL